jgi:hypothetical protein
MTRTSFAKDANGLSGGEIDFSRDRMCAGGPADRDTGDRNGNRGTEIGGEKTHCPEVETCCKEGFSEATAAKGGCAS